MTKRRHKNKGMAEEKREEKKKRERVSRTADEKRSFVHSLLMLVGIGLLVLVIGVMVVSNFIDHPLLNMPREIISKAFSPVQEFFSGAANTVTGYFRTLKYRSNLEYEYEQLLNKVEELQDQVMLLNATQDELSAYEDLYAEMSSNTQLDPIPAMVIGHDNASYFSTLTLNRGTNNGVANNMAVVVSGGLVGVTYDVTETTVKVRTIIDSDCSIAAMLESSHYEGIVSGTLGIDGTPNCRMYYLSENHLPRTGDVVVTSGVGIEFPKGIPIGTVRESTRGLEGNKQYVVIEPIADFERIEYVTIYRYLPPYAQSAASEETTQITVSPLVTGRPKPTFAVGAGTSFEEGGQTAEPTETDDFEIVSSETPSPTPTIEPTPTPTDLPPVIEYQSNTATETPIPTDTPRPTGTPKPTFDPSSVTVEDD